MQINMLKFFKEISNKRKFYIILYGLIFLYLFAYLLTIRKTVKVYSDYKEIKNQLEYIGNAPDRLSVIKNSLIYIDSLIGNYKQSNFQFQLLENISNFCQDNNIIFKSFPKVHQVEEQNFLVNTYVIECDGSFLRLLNLVYFLEQKKRLGKIVSLNFQVKKEQITNYTRLFATIYIQSLSNKNELIMQ